jgi:hypothetical protein
MSGEWRVAVNPPPATRYPLLLRQHQIAIGINGRFPFWRDHGGGVVLEHNRRSAEGMTGQQFVAFVKFRGIRALIKPDCFFAQAGVVGGRLAEGLAGEGQGRDGDNGRYPHIHHLHPRLLLPVAKTALVGGVKISHNIRRMLPVNRRRQFMRLAHIAHIQAEAQFYFLKRIPFCRHF